MGVVRAMIDGNEVVARVAYKINEIIAIYPMVRNRSIIFSVE